MILIIEIHVFFKKILIKVHDNLEEIKISTIRTGIEKYLTHFKKNDNNFIIYELNGRTLMGFNKCLEKKNLNLRVFMKFYS